MGQPPQPREQFTARTVLARRRIEYDAPAERVRRRDPADHEPVAPGRHEWLLQSHLPERAAEPREPSRALAGPVVDLDAVAVLGLVVLEAQLGVEQVRRAQPGRRCGEHVPAPDVRHADPDEIDRHPLPGLGTFDRPVMDLHAAHPDVPALGEQTQFVATRRGSRPTASRSRPCRPL